jgi:hypothetical protein
MGSGVHAVVVHLGLRLEPRQSIFDIGLAGVAFVALVPFIAFVTIAAVESRIGRQPAPERRLRWPPTVSG